MEEIWKDIKGYEGLYRVSNYGNIWTNKRKRCLKQHVSPGGYYQVTLSKQGKVRTYEVHRLVSLNFIPIVDGKNIVNHIDENKLNNNVENLEWCTPKENINYGTGIKRALETKKASEKFKRSFEIRSTPVIGINILDGSKVEYESMSAAEKDGFRNGGISNCILGKTKTHAGYKWYKTKQRTLMDELEELENRVKELEDENKMLRASQAVLPEDKEHNRKAMEGLRSEVSRSTK